MIIDEIINKRLEEIAIDCNNAETSKEKNLYDNDARNFIGYFIANNEEHKKYWDYYEEKRGKK
jgi:hypothetical protein